MIWCNAIQYNTIKQNKTKQKQESAFDKHKWPQKHKIIKQMFSVFAYICIFFQNSKISKQKQNCKDNSSDNNKLWGRNDFDSVGDCDLELIWIFSFKFRQGKGHLG